MTTLSRWVAGKGWVPWEDGSRFRMEVVTDKAQVEQDSRMYESVKTALLACLRGYNPAVALEFARKTLPSDVRPPFVALGEAHRAA